MKMKTKTKKISIPIYTLKISELIDQTTDGTSGINTSAGWSIDVKRKCGDTKTLYWRTAPTLEKVLKLFLEEEIYPRTLRQKFKLWLLKRL